MPNTDEQRLDVIANCEILLNTILKPFEQTDATPEGRMIAQLKWLKERAENHDLPLPVPRENLSTLLRVYVDGELCRYASAPERVQAEVEIYLDRLVSLTKKAQLLLKPPYYPYAVRCTDALLRLMREAARALSAEEQGAIGELMQLEAGLANGTIEPPLGSCLPDYPNFNEMYMFSESSVDDLPNGHTRCKMVQDLIFDGVRPDSWLTPEAAERDTAGLV